jgi:uncharacterized membrane protein
MAMGHYYGNTKSDRESFTQARLLRLIACVLGTAVLFSVLFGEWIWHLQLVLGAIVGVSISILTEILLLIWQDERNSRAEHTEQATVRPTQEWKRPD